MIDAMKHALAAADYAAKLPVGDPLRYAAWRRVTYFEQQLNDCEYERYQSIRRSKP